MLTLSVAAILLGFTMLGWVMHWLWIHHRPAATENAPADETLADRLAIAEAERDRALAEADRWQAAYEALIAEERAGP